jgi:CO/xanthine dehydrogenase Mo-binding subunit
MLDIVPSPVQALAGPFGAEGVGEPAMLATRPAERNAISRALGVRLRRLPAPPARAGDAA